MRLNFRYLILLFAFSFCLTLNGQNTLIDSANFFEKQSDYQLTEKYYEKAISKEQIADSAKVEALISLARAKRINQKYPEGIALLRLSLWMYVTRICGKE